MEAVSNLDMKAESSYWRMQQCRGMGQVTESLEHEGVLELGSYWHELQLFSIPGYYMALLRLIVFFQWLFIFILFFFPD